MQTRSEVKNEFKETEIGLIPENWKVVKLGEIITYQKGRKPDNLTKEYQNGCKPYLTAEYFRTGKSKQFVNLGDTTSFVEVDKEDIVLIWDGTNAGDVFTGLSGVLASTMVKIYPKDNVIRSFLFYFLKTKFNVLNSQTTGSTIPHINKMVLENIQVALPPLSEQQKIAFVLSKIQQAIQQQDKIIEATKNLKKSLMHKLFTEGTRGEEQKETEIGLIPKSWEVKPLGEVVNFFQYGLSVKGIKQARYPIIRMNNLEDGYILCDDLQYVNLDDKTFNRFRLIKGDILFNRTNSIDLVGKTSIFDLEGDFVFASYLIRLKVKQEVALPRFVVYYLNWDKSQARLKGLATRAVGQSNISATRLSTFLIPLPSLSEQQQIANTLSRLDRKIEIEKRKKSLIQQLFKTMLNKLMTGEIRVKDIDLGVINVS
jgi:type I restriction enzyme S subunit